MPRSSLIHARDYRSAWIGFWGKGQGSGGNVSVMRGRPTSYDEIFAILGEAEHRALAHFGAGSPERGRVLLTFGQVLHHRPWLDIDGVRVRKTREALRILEDAFGPAHPEVLASKRQLGQNLLVFPRRGEYVVPDPAQLDETVALAREALDPTIEVFGPSGSAAAAVHGLLGRALLWRGEEQDPDEAIRALGRATDYYRESGPRLRGSFLSGASHYRAALSRAGRSTEALRVLEEVMPLALDGGRLDVYRLWSGFWIDEWQSVGDIDGGERLLFEIAMDASTEYGETSPRARVAADILLRYYERAHMLEKRDKWQALMQARGGLPSD